MTKKICIKCEDVCKSDSKSLDGVVLCAFICQSCGSVYPEMCISGEMQTGMIKYRDKPGKIAVMREKCRRAVDDNIDKFNIFGGEVIRPNDYKEDTTCQE